MYKRQVGTGVGFIIALTMMGGLREVLGYGSFLGVPLFGPSFEPWIVMILPAGGFFALGFILLLFGWWEERKRESTRPRHWPHSVTIEVDEPRGAAATAGPAGGGAD